LRTQKAALSRGLSIAKVGTLFQLQSSGWGSRDPECLSLSLKGGGGETLMLGRGWRNKPIFCQGLTWGRAHWPLWKSPLASVEDGLGRTLGSRELASNHTASCMLKVAVWPPDWFPFLLLATGGQCWPELPVLGTLQRPLSSPPQRSLKGLFPSCCRQASESP
jgi:hypothetical protein